MKIMLDETVVTVPESLREPIKELLRNANSTDKAEREPEPLWLRREKKLQKRDREGPIMKRSRQPIPIALLMSDGYGLADWLNSHS